MKNSTTNAFGILSLSLLTIMAGAAVSPALADIQAHLKGAEPTLVKMILTLPAVLIIPTSYAIGRFSASLNKKKLALIGVAIYTAAGCWAITAQNIYTLLASRALLGVAVGIIMPVAAALIADYYHGEMRMKMMGYNAAFANFGGILATFTSGLLASLNWRYAFLVYALGIPVFIIAALLINEPEKPAAAAGGKNAKLPKEALFAAFPAFLVFLGFYAIPTNISFYLVSKGIGGPAQAGYALALATGTAMTAGLFTAKVRKNLGSFFVPSILLAMFACHLMLGFTHSVLTVNLAMIANGYTLSMAIPYIMMRATEKSGGNNVKATSAVTSFVFLGQFFSPVVLDSLGGFFGAESAEFSFRTIALCTLAALVWVVAKKTFSRSY
jgi:MFS family permease